MTPLDRRQNARSQETTPIVPGHVNRLYTIVENDAEAVGSSRFRILGRLL